MKKDVMENAIVSIAILVIAIFVISACGSSLERTAPAQDIQHTDEEQVGSFDDGSQMAFEKKTVSDWKTAYLDYLLKNTDADSYADWKCWLAYIDGDEIPELFFYQPNAQFVVSFLACVDGQVVDLGEFGGQGAALWYQEKAGNLLESGAMMGNSFLCGYHFHGGELEDSFYAATDIPPWCDEDDSEAGWEWDGEAVSKEEYDRRVNKAVDNMTHEIYYDNGMSFDDLCHIWNIP